MATLLKKAESTNAFAKVGLYGDAGSGKTFTASCLAIGLHKFANCQKPIAFFDTEPSASYVLPLFKEAGIELLVCDTSRALKDLMVFMEEAEKECSVVIIDSITHVWRDIQKSYIDKINQNRKRSGKSPTDKIEFQDWAIIKDQWGKFTDKFLCSKVHVMMCGRMGSIYEYQTNERTGKKELITVGTKMSTEKELGYEPSLLIEMVKSRENGKITNRAFIEKDRWNRLNGDEIDFEAYKGVSMKNILATFNKLKPHFELLNIGGAHHDSMNTRNSQDLYEDVGSDENWSGEQRKRSIFSEEIQGLLLKHYPGQTVEEKKIKAELVEKFAETRSWTKVESMPSNKLKEIYEKMRAHLEVEKNPSIAEIAEIAEIVENTIIEDIKKSQDSVSPLQKALDKLGKSMEKKDNE